MVATAEHVEWSRALMNYLMDANREHLIAGIRPSELEWQMNHEWRRELHMMVDKTGYPLWQDEGYINNGQSFLLGYPVVMTEKVDFPCLVPTDPR